MAGPDMFEITIDGNLFCDISGFYSEVNRVFMAGEDWQIGESLDALNDLLYGGFGSLRGHDKAIVRWVNLKKSRNDLGVAATRQWLSAKLRDPSRFRSEAIGSQLAALERGEGQTYFDIVIEIIGDHSERIRLVQG